MAEAIWETPTGQTLAESNSELVHIDAQGFVPALPDAHFVGFPILSAPSTTAESISARQPPETSTSPSQFASIEIFLHRLLAATSIPLDLLIPPYSNPLPPLPTTSSPSRLGKIALHPELPIVAFAQAHAGGTIFLFDLRTNAFLKYKLVLPPSDLLNALAFSKYNLLAAGMCSGKIIIYDLNLSVAASTSTKPLNRTAIPSYASLVPAQLPAFALLGEITDLDFDAKSGNYLAIATTRSGTWIYDTVYSSSLRLSKYPSSAVAFSPTENVLAVARERTGEIELYTMIRAGTLTFSLPTVSKSGFKTTVTRMQWAEDGKSLLYCNEKQEGIRILYVQCQPVIPPLAQYLGNIVTPVRTTTTGVPYGGVPSSFTLDNSSKRLVVSYTMSPLLEVFSFTSSNGTIDTSSIGLIRGPSTGRGISEKAKGKRPEGQSPFDEDSWEKASCVDIGFVGRGVGDRGTLFAGGWNGDDGGKVAFVGFYLDDISV